MSLEVIFCRRTIILVKFSVIERNVLSKEDFYSQMKKFIVTGRNLQSQEEIYCRRERLHFRGQNLLSEQEFFSLGGINFLPEKNISFQRKMKFL